MKYKAAPLTGAFLCVTVVLHGQGSVCDLFKNLKAADGRRVNVQGELIISNGLAALGAADCENRYISMHYIWPTALHLRPSANLPADQLHELDRAAAESDRLRLAGKLVGASATFQGRVHVAEVSGSPAELLFDSVQNLKVEALPDPSEVPVIPICELFQNLPAWKGKRIAVRGEIVGTFEGSWIVGQCKGSFYTNGYRWPVSLSYAGPAYYSRETASLTEAKLPDSPPKGEERLRGRYNVVKTATLVGRLRMRDEYTAVCRGPGDYLTNGFGHLNGAAAELIVDTVRSIELAPRPPADDSDDANEQGSCQLPNLAARCSGTTSLPLATRLGCVDRVRELLTKGGIDSSNGSESAALGSAIQTGNEVLVKLLIEARAPVNPVTFQMWPPLAEAAHYRKIAIMKALLRAGANVEAPDHDGVSYLANYGFFFSSVTKTLLEAGANPNATDSRGQTALMQASGYGYQDAIRLLIEHKADVNLKDHGGRSALMHAAAGKYVDAIPLLIEGGADMYARDREGSTALDLARKSNNQVAAELLSVAMKRAK